MLNNLLPALRITRREVRDQFRDWRIIFPIVGLTVFFPFLMNFTAQQLLDFVRGYGASIIGERLVPFLLMIVGFFPISVSLVIALETFVGEKERGSIEPLLNTPLKDWQLYLGKLLAATVPPLFASFLGMAVYITGLLLTHVPLPPTHVVLQIIALTVVQAFMMVSGAVVVSSQATSVRAANLLASFIIIPSALLIQGESIVLFWGDWNVLWWAVGGLVVLSVLLVRVGLAHFQREELLGREIDVLNLKWAWRIFRSTFTGGAVNLRDWYLGTLPRSLRAMRTPFWVVLGVFVLSAAIGVIITGQYSLPNVTDSTQVRQALQALPSISPAFSVQPVLLILWQNLRVLLAAFLLGAISFGILGILLVMITWIVAGLGVSLLVSMGVVQVGSVLGMFLPHGLVEIPAILLATAAILRAGALLATPDARHTIGEVWIASIAEWLKIMLGVVLPLLLVGAALEAWVTLPLAQYLIR